MNEGISLKELAKFFEYIERAMKDNKTTVVIDNGMCRFLYTYLKELSSYNDMQFKEIDRLNNIINELEDYLLEYQMCMTNDERDYYEDGIKDCLDEVLDKMKEIKERNNVSNNNKNEV